MNNTDLPPLPEAGEYGPQVCATIRLYLAVLDDLSPQQVHVLSRHVANCTGCAVEFRLLRQATDLVAGLTRYAPPSKVDQVVLATIAARSSMRPSKRLRVIHAHRASRHRRFLWLIGHVAAALVLLAVLSAVPFLSAPLATPRAFALPANLSWSGYVLYYSETKVDAHGVQYRINCYHDLGTGRMHVETIAGGGLDVVVVGDEQSLLGEDLTHHIAQWGANAWGVDDSVFNLAQLRRDLQENRVIYEGTDRFNGQEVYRIRWRGGLVLLLDMNYRPVNVLRHADGPGTGEPIYETLSLLPVSEVPNTLWDIRVPAGFRIGELPARP